ncbi:MAG: anti-sigma factor family protein [Fibrobacterota bacterium]
MSCERSEEVYLYFFEELSSAGAQDFARHLDDCSSCQNEYALLKKVSHVIQRGGGLEQKIDAACDKRIKQAIIRMRTTKYHWALPWTYLMKKSALALIILATGFFAGRQFYQAGPQNSSEVHSVAIGSQEESSMNYDTANADTIDDFIENQSRGILPVGIFKNTAD